MVIGFESAESVTSPGSSSISGWEFGVGATYNSSGVQRSSSIPSSSLFPKEAMGMASDAAQQPTPSEATPDQVQALLEAARYDDIEDVVSLYSVGVSLNSKDSQGRTALHMASANGHLDIVEYLISNGADVNVANSEKNTPLHWACLNGHIEVLKTLIQNGASLSVLNSHERTPMDEAVSSGKMEVVDAINAAVAQAELTSVSVS